MAAPRRDTAFLALLLTLGCLMGAMVAHARSHAGAQAQLACRELVATQGLTDLCLSTEARYTRHPAMADLHAPFQDHPGAREHFPTGGLMSPPRPHAPRP